ncbi:MAG: c-type cytochrome [Isosphaeraceae bacterium]|nr:c-type cytochrome [Isosphaeraceae bacterium]
MSHLPGSLAALVVATPLALSGCGGAGQEAAAPKAETNESPAATATAKAVTPAEGTGPAVSAPKRTPTSGINPEKQIDVVREEVKGGEATAGPTPFDYLWQPAKQEPSPDEPLEVQVPLGLQPLITNVNVPAANPLTKAKMELGKQLYFDPRLSKDGTISCATCHNPEKGWTDNLDKSIGIHGLQGSRSAPTVLNTVYGRSMFWDGRAPSLEAQAQGPIQNKIEMGDQSYKEIVERLRLIPGYQEQFRRVFGTDVTLDGLVKAIATFERTVLSGHSAYDRYNGGGGKEPEFDALTESQKRGMVLFGLRLHPDDPSRDKVDEKLLKKAGCTSCHVGFNFTDEQFHNLGVGWDEAKREFADLGRWAISPIGAKYDKELGAFKTPTLRDISRTAPYMHDGSERTLEDVIEFYNKGGNKNPNLDPDMKPLNLTDQEKADVVAFLKALDGELVPVELPRLPPGSDGQAPDPREAFEPPRPAKPVSDRTAVRDFDPHAIFRR